MPQRPLRPCNQNGCAAVTRDRYCPAHARASGADYDRARGSAAARGYGRPWRKLRLFVLERDFYVCQDPG